MGNDKIGIVAGRGLYPILLAGAAKRKGVKEVAIVAIREDADPCLGNLADTFEWVYAGQLDKTIGWFKRNDIKNVIFAGQIRPAKLFKGLRPDFRALKLLATLRLRNAESIFSAVAREFQKDGITILPATTYLEDSLAQSGIIGKIKPSKRQIADIEYGVKIAREISQLNIGQTIVVKKGTVLAVEAFEGTDKAILRGGSLGGGGITVIKVAKPNQDMRFDVPCIGLRSVQTFIAAKTKAVALQSDKTLLLEKDAIIKALNQAKISIIGVSIG